MHRQFRFGIFAKSCSPPELCVRNHPGTGALPISTIRFTTKDCKQVSGIKKPGQGPGSGLTGLAELPAPLLQPETAEVDGNER